jgi:hypothetical protein
MLIYNGGLRFPETHEIDKIGEDFRDSLVRRFGQVGKSKIVDTTLKVDGQTSAHPLMVDMGARIVDIPAA